MKKLSILLGTIIMAGTTYSAQLELKAGIEPWREGKNSYADFDGGGSLGAELLFNAENIPLDYGLGFEWKSQFKGDSNSKNSLGSSKSDAFPLYVTGKYGVADDLFYLVGRAGWVMYDKSSVDDGLYGAVGVGKEFGQITLETLYETMDLKGSGERADIVSIKLGYRFGENRRDRIAREGEEAARLEYEKQQQEAERLAEERELQKANELEVQELEAGELEVQRLEAQRMEEARLYKIEKYTSPLIIANYRADNIEPDHMDDDLINNMTADLQDESGVLEINVYTDNLGAKTYNEDLSQKRADELSRKIRKVLANDNIQIRTAGLGGENFLNSNSTSEERYENRRAEVLFIAE